MKYAQKYQAWWYTHVIPALGRRRQEVQEFMIILSYIETSESVKTVKTCLKQKKKEKQQKILQ